MIRILVFLVIAGLLIYLLVGNSYKYAFKKRRARQIEKLLKRMDKTYARFIEEELTLSILQTNSLDVNIKKLLQESMKQLTPYIETLHYTMQQGPSDQLEIRYESEYFSNVSMLIDGYYSNTSTGRYRMPIAYQRLENAFKKAIQADIEERAIKMMTRNS